MTRSLTRLHGSLMVCVAMGALACAATPAVGQPLRDESGGFELQVLVDGAPAPTYSHRGGTYLLGELGSRYVLRVVNHTGRRAEAVVSVDGRDVIDGKPADFRNKRGYLVPAYGSVDIDGWRVSQAEAAAFRFSSVRDSYAARTGSAREVGVIGVAMFPERPPVARVIPRPEPRPWWAPGPLSRRKSAAADEAGAPPASEAPAAPPAPSASAERSGSGAASAPAPAMRPGLGTEYGEALASHIREVTFVRADAQHPVAVLGLRYDDREGLLALGIDLGERWPDQYGEAYLRGTADPFPVVHRQYAAPPPGWRR